METLNYFISLLLIIFMIFELFLIVTRNKKIRVRGHDDFFVIVLILFFAMVILPVKFENVLIESFRNVLIYMVIFTTFAIKRGFSDKGMEKVFFTIPWEKIETLTLTDHYNNKFVVMATLGNYKLKLIFNNAYIKKVADFVAIKYPDLKIQESLIKKIKK